MESGTSEQKQLNKCAFVITKRNRRCRMDAAKGSRYCGEHLLHDKEYQCASKSRRRIPCPLDPTHSVYEDALGKHLKKCNVTKRPVPAGYSRAINSGRKDELVTSRNLSSCSPDDLQLLISKVEIAYAKYQNALPEATEVKVHPSMMADLSDPHNGAAALKHLVQQASILGHIEACGWVGATSHVTCYIEFGAGRGKLTGCIHKGHLYHSYQVDEPGSEKGRGIVDYEDGRGKSCTDERRVQCEGRSPVDYVLVDKSSCRRKVDGTYRASQLQGATCHRLLIDIADLNLSGVEVICNDGHLVGVAKHLCGAATDLALRCLLDTLPRKPLPSTDKPLPPTASDNKPQLLGVAMALCCHHRCTWSALVGGDFLEQECGIIPEEFSLLCQLTSWAVCGQRPAQVPGQDKQKCGYVPHPKEHIGLKCKRLIDLARVHYLQTRGFTSRLVQYVERETSLENVLLLATPGSSTGSDSVLTPAPPFTGSTPAPPFTGSTPAPPFTGSTPAPPFTGSAPDPGSYFTDHS